MNLFSLIRHSCRRVAEYAGQVTIDHGRIADYVTALPLEQATAPTLDPARHYLGHGADTATFFIVLDTINFGSGYFPHLNKRPGHSGYFTVAASLTDYFRQHGPPSAERLASLDAEFCARLFDQQPLNEPRAALMTLFAEALNALGRTLRDRYDGQAINLIESAEGSAERLARLLAQMPFFDDRTTYRGEPVYFYKRAQLTAADLALALSDTPWGRFDDLPALTIFADNLIPHVLRLDGMLRYDPALAEAIDAGRLIDAGSEAETELRACALHAVELIVAALKQNGHAVTAMGLDYLLWNRGQQPWYKQHKPRHRARTVFY